MAPADRKAVYMGYAFLYGVFGSLLGSSLGGFLYYAFSQDEVQPRMAVQALIFMALGLGGLMVGRGGCR